MALNVGQPSVLLDNVSKLIRQKVKAESADLVEQFAKTLYRNISKDDLVNRNDSDMYGAALSLWNALYELKDDLKPVIRVFNPDLSKNGWESPHTVVEIIVEDMPFLVDSVRMALSRHALTAHLLLHCPIKFQHDANGFIDGIFSLDDEADAPIRRTVFLIEISRQNDKDHIDALTQDLHSVINDVSSAVKDWHPIRDRLNQVIADLPTRHTPDNEQLAETLDFLKWVVADNFTLMGYRQYAMNAIAGDYEIVGVPGSSLGLMKSSASNKQLRLSKLPESARNAALNNNLLLLTKANSRSRVHRPANIDYIGVKRFDDKGNVIGEDRFIGLFSSNFYNNSAKDIPLLKQKFERILKASGFARGTHAHKALLNILETYPRDELLQASEAELLEVATGVLQIQERDMTKVFMRRDPFGRYFSCMVYVPRERYNTQLRKETQKILAAALESNKDVEFTTYFSESVLARTHYIVQVTNNNIDVDVKQIQNNLVEAARSWEDKLSEALAASHGEARGLELFSKYGSAFPRAYKEETLPRVAVVDIERLEALTAENPMGMVFYRPQEEQGNPRAVRLSLYHKDEPIHLSDVLPMLENFGLRVIGETPYAVKTATGSVNWVMDFTMLLNKEVVGEFEQAQALFQAAFTNVWHKQLEDDGFNRLVLGAGLTGRGASILRAYAKYLKQIGMTFSQAYIESTFDNYPAIAGLLVAMFKTKFNPAQAYEETKYRALEQQIIEALDNVSNADDDRIIRRFVELINATLRTNYFQTDEHGQFKPYVSFKVKPSLISEMPLPLPHFEIWVYSPRVEGVHLRGGKVARGGLRWSDRREDFRTEVLGLVKAQQVKNTVIVPVGAKGGFFCKQLPTTGGRDAYFEEGQNSYRTFIRALLDITDNIVDGNIVPPVNVVRHDEDDPYLVVAADKGTATFSDIANAISLERNFWLGDAFASGGSVGYDHKKMGITARGGWESVKRHFREMGIDCQTTDFTAIGIGDMAGDVFGNGMLLSRHTKLVAAFNHMHIFLDPNPDAEKSFVERERMFNLPRSSWEDYDKSLISQGGGIFLRSAKSIKLSPEVKAMLNTSKDAMAPTELIRAILTMEVDLIWNGGIGTYVKAQSESNSEVGDRANDGLRVNGRELKAKVFGEGGNLGMTQLGRVEFAARGGRLNTDFIDNVGGVDCSDNEVNIKILLNTLVGNGDLTKKQRDELLYSMTDDVSRIVLQDCYRQTQSMSVTEHKGAETLKEQIRFIHAIEKAGLLNRELEFIPNDEQLAERQVQSRGLTRPEIAILTAYSKMVLKQQFVTPEISDNDYFRVLLVNAFPPVLRQKFAEQMEQHPLRAEIIATKLANEIVNDMGFNFVQRMAEETGASPVDVAVAYATIREVFELDRVSREIEGLDNVASAAAQIEMFYQLRRTVRRATRWLLRHRSKGMDIRQAVAFFKPTFDDLAKNVQQYLVEGEYHQLQGFADKLQALSVPANLASRIAHLSTLFSSLDLAQVVEASGKPIGLVADVYFKLGDKLGLHWFLDQITKQPVANHWQALARASYREELDWQQRSLTQAALKYCSGDRCDTAALLEQWTQDQHVLLERWQHMLAEFKTSSGHEFAKFSVALRELMLLSHSADTAN